MKCCSGISFDGNLTKKPRKLLHQNYSLRIYSHQYITVCDLLSSRKLHSSSTFHWQQSFVKGNGLQWSCFQWPFFDKVISWNRWWVETDVLQCRWNSQVKHMLKASYVIVHQLKLKNSTAKQGMICPLGQFLPFGTQWPQNDYTSCLT